MNLKLKTLFTLLSLSLLLGACADKPPAEEPCNFVMNSNQRRVSWAQMPIRFYADTSLSDQQFFETKAAMEVWNKEFNRPVFELIGLTRELPPPLFHTDGRVVADGYNGIYVMPGENFENTREKNEQARTSISFRGDYIYESDVLIDASEKFYYQDQEIRSSTQSVHYKSLLVHELGHVLGLEHIDDEQSVMNPKLQFGEFRISISPEDFESLACEYQ